MKDMIGDEFLELLTAYRLLGWSLRENDYSDLGIVSYRLRKLDKILNLDITKREDIMIINVECYGFDFYDSKNADWSGREVVCSKMREWLR